MTLNGIDVSAWQPAQIGAMVPADFVIVKGTGGAWYENPRHQQQLTAASQAGVDRLGLYHFAHEGAKQAAAVEAAHFARTWAACAGHVAPMLPVLDWEDGDTRDTAWALDWCRRIQDATGKTPLLYCNLSVATSNDWSAVQALGVQLWLAWYLRDNKVDGYAPPLPEQEVALRVVEAGWDMAIWQYTQHGRLPGYAADLDLNVAYRDVWASQGGSGLLVPGVPLP